MTKKQAAINSRLKRAKDFLLSAQRILDNSLSGEIEYQSIVSAATQAEQVARELNQVAGLIYFKD